MSNLQVGGVGNSLGNSLPFDLASGLPPFCCNFWMVKHWIAGWLTVQMCKEFARSYAL